MSRKSPTDRSPSGLPVRVPESGAAAVPDVPPPNGPFPSEEQAPQQDWTPRPWPTHGRPKGGFSRTVVDRLAADISSGVVRPGQRLPPQRLLALRLGVTPGTVARAYAEAERRGLVRGEVGRGTFVRSREGFEDWYAPVDDVPSPEAAAPQERFELRFNHPPVGDGDELTAELEETLCRALSHQIAGSLLSVPGPVDASEADPLLEGLRCEGRDLPTSNTLLTGSATAALSAILDSTTRAGDVVLCERLTYPGLRALAAERRLQLVGIEQDAYGLLPASLGHAIERYRPTAIYCGPNLQNPTGSQMTLRRRIELAGFVERSQVALIEDDVYGPLIQEPLPTVTSLVPDRGYYITNLAKSLAPGVRLGICQVPTASIADISRRLSAQHAWAQGVMVAAASYWAREGILERALGQRRRQAAARQALMRARLGGVSFDAHPSSFHVWLALPEPWSSSDFEWEARRLGVLVQTSESFRVDGPEVPRVRLCLGQEPSLARLDRALRVLSKLLQSGPERVAG